MTPYKRGTYKPTDLEDYMKAVEKIGTTLVPEFKIDSRNRDIYEQLVMWHMGDPQFEDRWGYDLNKGIMLSGNVGTGKTLAMQIFQYDNQREYNFPVRYRVVSTRTVSNQYAENGHSGIQIYGRKSFVTTSRGHGTIYNYDQPIHRCFDDLGVEDNTSKFYGSKANVMSEILLDRYDMYMQHGQLTLITTNLTSQQIEDVYGDRVRSRLRQMVNRIKLLGEDRR